MSMVISKITRVEHDEVPRTLAVGELEQCLGHKGFAGDYLHFQFDAMRLKQGRLDKAHGVFQKLTVDNHLDRRALIGLGSLAPGQAHTPNYEGASQYEHTHILPPSPVAMHTMLPLADAVTTSRRCAHHALPHLTLSLPRVLNPSRDNVAAQRRPERQG